MERRRALVGPDCGTFPVADFHVKILDIRFGRTFLRRYDDVSVHAVDALLEDIRQKKGDTQCECSMSPYCRNPSSAKLSMLQEEYGCQSITSNNTAEDKQKADEIELSIVSCDRFLNPSMANIQRPNALDLSPSMSSTARL